MSEYNLGTARGRIEIDSSGAVAGVAGANTAMAGMTKQSKASSAAMTAVGVSSIGMGVAIAGGFALAVGAAAGFEKELSNFKALSGATEDQLQAVSDKALQLGRDTSFGAGEAAQGMTELVKAGLTVEQILNGAADAALALAEAGEIDLASSAAIMSAAMNSFQLDAEEAIHVADLFAGTAASSATDVSAMSISFEQSAATAAALGVGIDDLSTAIGLMAKRGITGGKAGTALRAVLLRLQPQSETAATAMKELGLITEDGSNAFFDAEGNMKSLAEVSGLLQSATADLSAEQRTQAFNTIFGQEALAGALTLAEEGEVGFNDLADAIGAVSAQDVAAEKLDNLSGSLTILKGTIETALISAGAPFQEGLKGIVDLVTQAVNWFASLNPEIQKWVGIVVAGAGALALLVGAFLLANKAITAVKAAMVVLNATFLANPITYVVLALAALVAGLIWAYNNVESFRDIVDRAFAAVRRAMEPVGDFIQNIIDQWGNLVAAVQGGDVQGIAEVLDNMLGNTGNFIEPIRNIITAAQDMWEALKPVVSDAWAQIIDWAQKLWTWIDGLAQSMGGWERVIQVVAVALAAIVAPIPTLIAGLLYLYNTSETFRNGVAAVASFITGTVVPALQTLAGIIGGALAAAWSWITGTGIPALQSFGQTAADVFMSVVGWVQDNVVPVMEDAGELLVAIFEKIGEGLEAMKAVWDAIWPVLEPIVAVVVNAIQLVIETFVGVVQNIWNLFGDNLVSAFESSWNLLKGIVEGVLGVIRGIINIVTGIIKGDWSQVWEGIKQIFSGVWTAIKAIVVGAIDAVKLVIETSLDTIHTIWDAAWNLIGGILTGVWNTIVNVVSTAFGFVLGIIQGHIDMVVGIWTGAWDTVTSILQGAWDGIRNGVSTGIEAVVGFVGGLPGKAVSALGSIGSTLLQKGRDLIDGLWNGAKAVWTAVYSWITGRGSAAVSAAAGLGGKLISAGRQIIQGLWDGMKEKWSEVTGWLSNLNPANYKGPPERDKKMLVDAGELIMTGLRSGLAKGWEETKRQLRSFDVAVPLSTDAAVLAAGFPGSPTGGGDGPINITINFGDNMPAKDAEELRAMVDESGMIGSMISAIRAGTGRNA